MFNFWTANIVIILLSKQLFTFFVLKKSYNFACMKNWISVVSKWYTENRRDLPWRRTKHPYNIWVSEIILQQTRVDQALSYYHRFIETFPDIGTLATASVEDVLRVWKGLGYYRRALHMHETAKLVVSQHNGIFPKTYNEILKLKGVGRYTAAAIASIAFDEKVCVIDGNVHRVFSRFYAKAFSKNDKLLEQLVEKEALKAMQYYTPGEVNQAMMEFGAIICKPIKPLCNQCVINDKCAAYQKYMISAFPIKTEKIQKKTLYHHYFFVHYNGFCYLYQRTNNDIWKHLYEFPLIVTPQKTSIKPQNIPFLASLNIKSIRKEKTIQHILSHRTIEATLYHVEVEELSTCSNFLIVPVKNITQYPISKLMEKLMDYKLFEYQ